MQTRSHVDDGDRQGIVDTGEFSTARGDSGNHVLRSRMVAERVQIHLVRLEGPHTTIDVLSRERHGVCGLCSVDEQSIRLPRFESPVLEVGEDPGIVGITDRIDGGDAGMAMVDVIESPLNLEVEGCHDDRIRSEFTDLPRYCLSQLVRGFQQTIREVEDLQIVDADDIARPTLLIRAQR